MLENFSEVAESMNEKNNVDTESAFSVLDKFNETSDIHDESIFDEEFSDDLSEEAQKDGIELVLDRMNDMLDEAGIDSGAETLSDKETDSVLDKFNDAFLKENSEDNFDTFEQNEEKAGELELRELTDEEKEELKEKLNWTDKQISKCTIDENGVIHYKTDCEYMECKENERGIPYERKTVEINGITIEGVFPVFDSTFDVQLPEDLLQNSNLKQFKECNHQLYEAIEKDPELKAKFTDEQIEDIENMDTPTGYVWHHNEEVGKMQLVKVEDHDRTQGGAAHTGGKALWGGGYGNSSASNTN